MAKIPYSKFKIKNSKENKIIKFNDIEIELNTYLPIQEKLQLIGNIVNKARDEDKNYFNPVKIKIFTELEILFFYSNISFTEKQKENIPKLYDELNCSGLINIVLENIPEEEKDLIFKGTKEIVKSIYEYQNSAFGIVENLSKTFEESKINADSLQEQLESLKDSELYKDLISSVN